MAKKGRQGDGGGAPPKYATAKALEDAITLYFEDSKTVIPNKAGLRVALGISKDTYNEYRKRFPDPINAAEDAIEQAWIHRLKDPGATGAIFYLKAALGYQDKQEVDVTSGGQPLSIMWGKQEQ